MNVDVSGQQWELIATCSIMLLIFKQILVGIP